MGGGGEGAGGKKLKMSEKVVEGGFTLIECLPRASSVLGAVHTLFTLSHATP